MGQPWHSDGKDSSGKEDSSGEEEPHVASFGSAEPSKQEDKLQIYQSLHLAAEAEP